MHTRTYIFWRQGLEFYLFVVVKYLYKHARTNQTSTLFGLHGGWREKLAEARTGFVFASSVNRSSGSTSSCWPQMVLRCAAGECWSALQFYPRFIWPIGQGLNVLQNEIARARYMSLTKRFINDFTCHHHHPSCRHHQPRITFSSRARSSPRLPLTRPTQSYYHPPTPDVQ